MLTDWVLVRRLAYELEERFTGARVRDVGRLADGRVALLLWQRGENALLCIDVFAATPVLTVEEGELPISAEPGFVRAAGAALRNKTLDAVKSRRFDRVLRLDFRARSRFGVEDRYSLVCELVPRFGNVILTKAAGEAPPIIVAALKEFGPAENRVRSVEAGTPYEPPPVRGDGSTRLADAATAEAAAAGDLGKLLHVYRDDGRLVQAYLTGLPQFAHLQHSRENSLTALLAEARLEGERIRTHDALTKRRRSFERLLDERERKLTAELASVDARLRETTERDALRDAGEAIYASLHELPPAEQDAAKERAAALFAQYKKSAAAAGHLERRRAGLLAQRSDIESLRWELERTGEEHLDDFALAFAHLEAPQRRTQRAAPSRKRKPLQYVTPHGSRIYVGRTPIENAEITFRVAQPHDLWFHVQNQPGAHVILQRDGKGAPPDEDIEAAAALAALHSKAKNSPKVTVDYTQRKFVRKRPAAPPGLVFYTNPKSVIVTPGAPP